MHKAGAGERRITFVKDNHLETFRVKLEEVYPGLKDCGGFELLRSSVGSRVALELVKMPQNGFSTNFLANDSALGQALLYIRPIQKDIDTGQLEECTEVILPIV